MVRQLTEGWGDHGCFDEGDRPGTISSDTAFVPALAAWRVAGSKDFVTPQLSAAWLTLKWVMLTVPGKDAPVFPYRGSYEKNVLSRVGMSGSGTFAQGFGAVPAEYRGALLWTYNHCVSPKEVEYDTVSPYPHRTVQAFVNWPLGLKEQDPDEVLSRAVEDKSRAFYIFRNRWRDENDLVVTALLKPSKGNGSVPAGEVMTVSGGKKGKFAVPLAGAVTHFAAAEHGGVVSTATQSLLVDFSGASGAEGLLVMAHKGTPPRNIPGVVTVTNKDQHFTIQVLGRGKVPETKLDGDRLVIGGQTVAFDGENLSVSK